MAVAVATSAVIVLALGAYLLRGEERFSGHRLSGPEFVAFNAAVSAAELSFPSLDKLEPSARPVTVVIPAIGVVAPVTRLGLERDGSLEVPKGYSETGWWSGGPKPGQTGRAVIVGHVDSKSGPAVFANLQEVRRGDLVEVLRADGSAVEFEVRRVEELDKADFPTFDVYGQADRSELRLLTCGGQFDRSKGHYNRNVIVWATRVAV